MSNSVGAEQDAQDTVYGVRTDEPDDGESLLQIEAAIDELSALMNLSGQSRAPNNFQMSPNNRRDLAGNLSRPLQRKLSNLIKCRLAYNPEAKERLVKCIRSLAERTLTDLLLLHQNPAFLTRNLWMAVRNRGCQFLGPAMQEEVLRLILLALEDGSALSRKVLVLFVVQKLLPRYPRASKTSVGHVVQLLYRASCFKLQKREDDSSLMQLKEEFRNYEALRREHDAQIIQIAMDACIRISPESWSSLLYGDTEHRSQMQSIMDRLQMTQSQSFSGMLRELQNALQRTADPYNLGRLLADFEFIDKATKDNIEVRPGQILALLKRVQNLLVVYATISPLFALNRQNRHYPLATSQNTDAGSSNSLTSLLLNEPPQRNFNQLGNLCRNWSSMSSILSSQPEIQNQKLYSANLHASSQWIDQARVGQSSLFCQNQATLPQISTQLPSQKTVGRPPLDAGGVSCYSQVAPSQSGYQIGRGVIWRERPESPSSRLTKLPPRSPTARRCQEIASGYRHSGLPPRRQWTSVNSVLHAAPAEVLAVEDHDSPSRPINTSMRDEELIRLIRISKTIQNLERQKHDLLERLGRSDVIGRNASSLTNLAGELNMMENEPTLFQSTNDAIGFVSSNDTVVPFSQTPVHNKYGPICRSNRRLAQSLMAFPPLEESVSHEEQIEGLLSEQAGRLLAFEEDEDRDDLLHPDRFFNMKHATSMPAIPDDDSNDGLKISLGDEEDNPFKWIDVLDENEDDLKTAHRDKPRARSSIDLSAGNDVKNLTFA